MASCQSMERQLYIGKAKHNYQTVRLLGHETWSKDKLKILKLPPPNKVEM